MRMTCLEVDSASRSAGSVGDEMRVARWGRRCDKLLMRAMAAWLLLCTPGWTAWLTRRSKREGSTERRNSARTASARATGAVWRSRIRVALAPIGLPLAQRP